MYVYAFVTPIVCMRLNNEIIIIIIIIIIIHFFHVHIERVFPRHKCCPNKNKSHMPFRYTNISNPVWIGSVAW
jgi:hypothetical protein